MAEEDDDIQEASGASVLIPFAILFLPSAIIVLAFYLLLRMGRLRLSSIFQIFIVFEIIIALLWTITSPLSKFIDTVKSGAITENIPSLLLAPILIYCMIGGVLGLTFVWWQIKQMKDNPHRLELKGTWQYQFKFRRGISQVLKRKKNIEGLKKGWFVDEEKAPLGLNEEEDDRVASRYYSEAATHTIITGSSGSGKTISMQNLIRTDIQNQIPTVIIDFKRSPEFASKIASWAQESGCEFYHFVNGDIKDYDIKHSKGPIKYDPLSSGSPTSKADMVLGMREYDTASAVYKANMQQLLQVLFSMLHYADRKKAPNILWNQGGVAQLASSISGGNFTELAIACEGTPIQKEAEEVSQQLSSKSGLQHAMEELRGQMRTIIASEYGPWMRTEQNDRAVNIYELTKETGNIIMFSLNSDSEPEFAKYVGSMILSDLTNTSAKRRNGQLKNQVNIYVDEFQAVNPTAVTGLLEKSRESKMAVTLAQQSFEQVVASAPANGEAYLVSILDTCSNFIVHNGMTEDSAQRLSKILGRHYVTKYRSTNKNKNFIFSWNWKNQRDSIVSTSEEEEWVFPPRKFMTLMSPTSANGYKSTAVVINKSCADPHYASNPGATARRLWIIPDDAVLDSYYDMNYRLTKESSFISIVHDDGNDVEFLEADNFDLKQAFSRPAQKDDFDPSDNGDFQFEELPVDDDLKDFKNELDAENTPVPEPEVNRPKKLDEILSQFDSSAIAPPSRRIVKNTHPGEKKESVAKAKPTGGLPTTGLPSLESIMDTKKEEYNDEDPDNFSLPDLSEL